MGWKTEDEENRIAFGLVVIQGFGMAEDFAVLNALCNGYGSNKDDEKDAQEFIRFLHENNITTQFENLVDHYSKFASPDPSQANKMVKFSAFAKDNKMTRLFGKFLIQEDQIDPDSFYIIETWIPEWMIERNFDKDKVQKFAENAKEWAAFWNVSNLFMFQHPQASWERLRSTIKIEILLIRGDNIKFLAEDDVSVKTNKFSVQGSIIFIDKILVEFVFAKKLIRRFFKIDLERSKYQIQQ